LTVPGQELGRVTVHLGGDDHVFEITGDASKGLTKEAFRSPKPDPLAPRPPISLDQLSNTEIRA
jgi:hypothetical protein